MAIKKNSRLARLLASIGFFVTLQQRPQTAGTTSQQPDQLKHPGLFLLGMLLVSAAGAFAWLVLIRSNPDNLIALAIGTPFVFAAVAVIQTAMMDVRQLDWTSTYEKLLVTLIGAGNDADRLPIAIQLTEDFEQGSLGRAAKKRKMQARKGIPPHKRTKMIWTLVPSARLDATNDLGAVVYDTLVRAVDILGPLVAADPKGAAGSKSIVVQNDLAQIPPPKAVAEKLFKMRHRLPLLLLSVMNAGATIGVVGWFMSGQPWILLILVVFGFLPIMIFEFGALLKLRKA